jgi:uroporphyrin-III C-methyltransferase/precorrin-2 dehydrogenase/sirohydrochlorin ferrochelatase
MKRTPLFPLFLRVDGRVVVVVGAGAVAERKIVDLVEARAAVVVIAKEATARVRELAASGSVRWNERSFRDEDLDGAWLTIAATDDAAVQARVASGAESRRIFCIAVDDPPNATAYSAAVVRRPPVTIAISSSGESPAITRLLREIIEQILPEPEWVDAARALRERWKRDKTPMGSRFAELVKAFKERA